MGREQKGLSERAIGGCAAVVSIPMRGSCDSLNLAVATGVVLYEALGQAEGEEPRGSGRVR
jgi:TrmH family RNA methyltransferase